MNEADLEALLRKQQCSFKDGPRLHEALAYCAKQGKEQAWRMVKAKLEALQRVRVRRKQHDRGTSA